MRVLVTGAAGFIGSALSLRLLDGGSRVVGVDDLNGFYDPGLKRDRLDRLARSHPRTFTFHKLNVGDFTELESLFDEFRPQRVVHLAAHAGVHHSTTQPFSVVNTNVTGFLSVLEACARRGVEHLVYASSSSVYGGDSPLPFSLTARADRPLSVYGATKRSNELLAHSYSHLHRLPTSGIRFFSVYGPWGRPDMVLSRFARNILEGRPIDVYNNGDHSRAFLYIDDAVEGLLRVLDSPPRDLSPPYRLLNLANDESVSLETLIRALEDALGKKAVRNLLPLQPADIVDASCDLEPETRLFGFRPTVAFEKGVGRFVDWYLTYHRHVS